MAGLSLGVATVTIDPEKILDVQILMTIVNGKVVYEKTRR